MPPDFNRVIFDIQISICQSSFLVIFGEAEINGPPVRSTNFEKKGQDGTDGKKSFFSNRPSVPSSTFAHKLLDGTAGFGAPKSQICYLKIVPADFGKAADTQQIHKRNFYLAPLPH